MGLDTKSEVSEIEGVIDSDGSTKAAATREAQGNWDDLDGGTYTTSSTNEEQLPSNPVPDGVAVLVHPLSSNADTVQVGPQGAATYPLTAGTDSYVAQVSNTDQIYVKATQSGDEVAFHYEANP